jgi:hypothetical protein
MRTLFTSSSSSSSSSPSGSNTATASAADRIAAVATAAQLEAAAAGYAGAVPLQGLPVTPPPAFAAAVETGDASVWFEPGPVRVTYGLKQQLKYLAQPPARSGLRGFVVSDPVVDVRVASWMLCSDSKSVEEDKWEGKNGRR